MARKQIHNLVQTKLAFFCRDWKLSNIVRSRKSSSSSKLSSNNSSGRSLHGIGGFGNEKRPAAAGGYSKKIIYTLIITNLLSLLLGAGIG